MATTLTTPDPPDSGDTEVGHGGPDTSPTHDSETENDEWTQMLSDSMMVDAESGSDRNVIAPTVQELQAQAANAQLHAQHEQPEITRQQILAQTQELQEARRQVAARNTILVERKRGPGILSTEFFHVDKDHYENMQLQERDRRV